MARDKVHNPHDRLVKRLLTNRPVAIAELTRVLPAAVSEALRWDGLEVLPCSFVDPQLQLRASDLLYSVPTATGRPVEIYVLVEHQSTPDAAMAARFLVYVGRVYERLLRERPRRKTVPWVFPVLLYQGRTGWRGSRRLSDLLRPRELQGATPPVELEFAVDDLSTSYLERQVAADLRQRDRGLLLLEMTRSMLWLFRHPEAADGERAHMLAQLQQAVEVVWGARAMRPFLVYLAAAFRSKSKVRSIMLEAASPTVQTMYTTIRDEWLAEGRAAGVRAGKADLLVQLLVGRGFPVDQRLRRRIAACRDTSELERWFSRAINAASLADVFDD